MHRSSFSALRMRSCNARRSCDSISLMAVTAILPVTSEPPLVSEVPTVTFPAPKLNAPVEVVFRNAAVVS